MPAAICSVCVERCPVPGAIDLVGVTPQVNERMCTGCGWCQHTCPAPNNAILMLPNPAGPSVLELEREAETASARGVQVRYDYDGESWCDTILPAAGGYRVVRVADRARPTGLS